MRSLIEQREQLRAPADRYVCQRVGSLKEELSERRREETQQELSDLEEYAEAERQRIREFIENYEQKAGTGSNMDIAIRGQQQRLNRLEQRIESRRRELERKAQIVSLAPEIENLCFAFPVSVLATRRVCLPVSVRSSCRSSSSAYTAVGRQDTGIRRDRLQRNWTGNLSCGPIPPQIPRFAE